MLPLETTTLDCSITTFFFFFFAETYFWCYHFFAFFFVVFFVVVFVTYQTALKLQRFWAFKLSFIKCLFLNQKKKKRKKIRKITKNKVFVPTHDDWQLFGHWRKKETWMKIIISVRCDSANAGQKLLAKKNISKIFEIFFFFFFDFSTTFFRFIIYILAFYQPLYWSDINFNKAIEIFFCFLLLTIKKRSKNVIGLLEIIVAA